MTTHTTRCWGSWAMKQECEHGVLAGRDLTKEQLADMAREGITTRSGGVIRVEDDQ